VYEVFVSCMDRPTTALRSMERTSNKQGFSSNGLRHGSAIHEMSMGRSDILSISRRRCMRLKSSSDQWLGDHFRKAHVHRRLDEFAPRNKFCRHSDRPCIFCSMSQCRMIDLGHLMVRPLHVITHHRAIILDRIAEVLVDTLSVDERESRNHRSVDKRG
jgi:hypothetical protein